MPAARWPARRMVGWRRRTQTSGAAPSGRPVDSTADDTPAVGHGGREGCFLGPRRRCPLPPETRRKTKGRTCIDKEEKIMAKSLKRTAGETIRRSMRDNGVTQSCGITEAVAT